MEDNSSGSSDREVTRSACSTHSLVCLGEGSSGSVSEKGVEEERPPPIRGQPFEVRPGPGPAEGLQTRVRAHTCAWSHTYIHAHAHMPGARHRAPANSASTDASRARNSDLWAGSIALLLMASMKPSVGLEAESISSKRRLLRRVVCAHGVSVCDLVGAACCFQLFPAAGLQVSVCTMCMYVGTDTHSETRARALHAVIL